MAQRILVGVLVLAVLCVTSVFSHPQASPNHKSCLISDEEYERAHPGRIREHIVSPLPHEYLSPDDVPENWDWRDVDGVNYVTPSLNQHIPTYCGSCWLHGTTSAFNDRMKIVRKAAFPEILVSRQVLLNCQECGSCEGGNPGCVYEYMHERGLPDTTCCQYRARDGECDSLAYCYTADRNGTLEPISNYTSYYAGEYGGVYGATKMKAEIYARGPVACGIMVTEKFLKYTGGIFSEWSLFPMSNHVISVVGFGKDPSSGEEYWIARNSWGTYWGEDGWFRIRMHKDNLGIEDSCSWAVPKF